MTEATTVLHEMFPQAVTAFETLLRDLTGAPAMAMTHAELEDHIATEGREVLRRAMQDHLDLRTLREPRRDDIVDAAGTLHTHVESDHTRPLTTILGDVAVTRKAYRQKGLPNLYPADAALNLPHEQYSHGLRKVAAIEATRGSYEETVGAIARATGQAVGKRQVEELVQRAAVDFPAFYTDTPRPQAAPEDGCSLNSWKRGYVCAWGAYLSELIEDSRMPGESPKEKMSIGHACANPDDRIIFCDHPVLFTNGPRVLAMGVRNTCDEGARCAGVANIGSIVDAPPFRAGEDVHYPGHVPRRTSGVAARRPGRALRATRLTRDHVPPHTGARPRRPAIGPCPIDRALATCRRFGSRAEATTSRPHPTAV